MNQDAERVRAAKLRELARLTGAHVGPTPPYYVVEEPPAWAARWPESAPIGAVLRWWTEGHDEPHIIVVSERDTFEEAARLIGNRRCEVATAWVEIPRVEPRPAGDEAVRDWAAQFLPTSDASTSDGA